MHLSEGELRAYQDQELNQPATQKVEEHLASCLRCQEKAEALQIQARRVDDKMSYLHEETIEEISCTKKAYLRFERRILEVTKVSRKWGVRYDNEIASRNALAMTRKGKDEIASQNTLAMTSDGEGIVTRNALAMTYDEEGITSQSTLAMTEGGELVMTTVKEKQTMWKKINSKSLRPLWVAILIIAVFSVSMAFPSVRAVANSFLKLFRVEQIQVIQVDTERFPGQLESSSQLERIFNENVKVDIQGEQREVSSVSEASEITGIPMVIPTNLGEPYKLLVQPGGTVTFQVDLELVRGVLKDIERSDIELPESLDGTSIRMEFKGGVLAEYGDCSSSIDAPSDPDDPQAPSMEDAYGCTTLMQAHSPTVSAPPELDITSLGEAYLQILGMSLEEAESFSRNIDWTTTFIIPIPRYRADYKEVDVNGVTGTLITHWVNDDKGFTLLWLKDGIIYALSGPGNQATALEIAGSLK